MQMQMQNLHATFPRGSTKTRRSQPDDHNPALRQGQLFINDQKPNIHHQHPQTRVLPQGFDSAPESYDQHDSLNGRASNTAPLTHQSGRIQESQSRSKYMTPTLTRRFRQEQRLSQAGLFTNLQPNQVLSINGQILRTAPSDAQPAPQSSYSNPTSHRQHSPLEPAIPQIKSEPSFSHGFAVTHEPFLQASYLPQQLSSTSHQPSHQTPQESSNQQPRHPAPTPTPTTTTSTSPPPLRSSSPPINHPSLCPWQLHLLATHPPPTPGPGAEETRRKARVEAIERTKMGLTGANAIPVGQGSSWDDEAMQEGGEGLWRWVPKKKKKKKNLK